MQKNEQVYYTWLVQSWIEEGDEIEMGSVFSKRKAALDSFVEWGEGAEDAAVLVEVAIKPLSKLVIGGVKEVPLA